MRAEGLFCPAACTLVHMDTRAPCSTGAEIPGPFRGRIFGWIHLWCNDRVITETIISSKASSVILGCALTGGGRDCFQVATKDRPDGDYKVWMVRDEGSDKECTAISFFLKSGGGVYSYPLNLRIWCIKCAAVCMTFLAALPGRLGLSRTTLA